MLIMNLKIILIGLFSIIGGIIITLFTGSLPYPTGDLIGVGKWGFPFYWLSQIVYPGSEKVVNWSNFIINVLIWSFISFLIIYISNYFVIRLKNRKSHKKI